MANNASHIEIEKYFAERHIRLKRNWLLEALNFVSAEKSQNNPVDLIYQQWLFTDIKESTEPIDGLSNLIDGRSFREPYIFQVNSLSDIGTSNLKQAKRLADPSYEEPTEFDQPYPTAVGRCSCFRLQLSDGIVELKAFEKKRVASISAITCLGSKILIYGTVELCCGYLFLTGENCQLLGGQKPTECVSPLSIRQMSEQRNATGSRPIGEGPNCCDTTEQQNKRSKQIGDENDENNSDMSFQQKLCYVQKPTECEPPMAVRQTPEQRNATGSRPIGEGPNCCDTTELEKRLQPERTRQISDDNNENNAGECRRKRPLAPTHEEDDAELFGRRVSKFLRSLSTTRRRRQACIGIEQLMMEFDEEEEHKSAGRHT